MIPAGITAIERELEETCRAQDFAGFCKFDALNSPPLERWFGGNALARLVVTQIVNRVPLPLRDWVRVEKLRNPMGVGNFVRGYWNCAATGALDPEHARAQALQLSEWLLQHASARLGAYEGRGTAWGYHFPWQSPGFFAPRHSPNCYVTVLCAEALLCTYQETRQERWLDAARGACEFILRELPILEEDGERKCIGYVQQGPKWKVININSVSAGLLAKVGAECGEAEYLSQARRMLNWTVAKAKPNHSWNYTEPFEQSRIGPDNYHTGGILDGIHDYMAASGDRSFLGAFERGLDFYQRELFTPDMAPKWRDTRPYPHDIHGCAQGTLTFCNASSLDSRHLATALRCIEWAAANMYSSDRHYFYYQKRKHFTWKINLMRWNNSWMFLAMSAYLKTSKGAQ
jgi:hypothetical protein